MCTYYFHVLDEIGLVQDQDGLVSSRLRMVLTFPICVLPLQKRCEVRASMLQMAALL